MNAGLFAFILKHTVLIWIEKCSVFVLQKLRRLVIFLRPSNVNQLTREVFRYHSQTLAQWRGQLLALLFKHCCAVPLVVFAHPLSTQLLHEAKEVVLGFVFFIYFFSLLIKVGFAKCLALLDRN